MSKIIIGIHGLGNKPPAPLLESWGRVTGTSPLYTRMSLGALRSNRHVSHGRATRELGYQPRPFRDTLADTIAWFKDNADS